MEPTNISIIGVQLINLTNNIVNLITFRDIYSYIFLEILVISFYVAMEANRVESIKTLLMGIMVVMWIFLIAILALERIGYININGPEFFTYFATPVILITVIALMVPLLGSHGGSGGSSMQNPPKLE
jgi:phosphoglycerol transferase MdoB-like AlkP superfamily enzyme